MFFTFKAASVAGEPRVCEPTPPPFSKKRDGKPIKAACTNCRTSKLRCSGDPGCRRCSSKKLWCEYTLPSHTDDNRLITGSSTELSAVQWTTNANSPVLAPSPYDLSYSGGMPNPLHQFDISNLTPPDTAGALLDDGASRRLSFGIDALWEIEQISSGINAHTLGSGLDKEIDSLMFDTSDSLSSSKAASISSHLACNCFQQAFSTNEAIEVAMWGQNALSSDIYNTLQQQKATLAKCADLLACQSCCTQPAYVMMLLSMCRKLLVTLERICQAQGGPGDQGRSASCKSGTELRKRKKSDGAGSTSTSEAYRGYGISIRERQLDDDDEFHVLNSLVCTRLKTLNSILDGLDKAMSRYNWPVHKGMCRELRASLRTESYI